MPASQFEIGQQKGGHFFCTGCEIQSDSVSDLKSIESRFMSLQERINKVKQTSLSLEKLRKNKLKLYENLDKAELISELRERNVHFTSDSPLHILRGIIAKEMHGIQRLPALMYERPNFSLTDLHLEKYEILCNEPLHDVSNHTKNLFAEVVHHIPKNLKKQLQTVIDVSFDGKTAKNSSDYRKSVIIIANWCRKNIRTHTLTKLFQTLAEIQEILYSPDKERTLHSILRLYNITFQHAILLHDIIKKDNMKGTERKLFGSYFHNIVCHAPDQYRILSGRSANTEKEESTFNFIKTNTKLTSNHHADNIITNTLIRVAARKNLNNLTEHQRPESYVNNIYHPLKISLKNTKISFKWMKVQSREYQCLLARQADYLLEAGWWEEKEDGVEFFDKEGYPVNTTQQLHHFRSTTITNTIEYVKQCWNKCIEQKNKLIPAYKLHYIDKSTKKITETLVTLKFFRGEEYYNTPISSSKTTSYSKEPIASQLSTQSDTLQLNDMQTTQIIDKPTLPAVDSATASPTLNLPTTPTSSKTPSSLPAFNLPIIPPALKNLPNQPAFTLPLVFDPTSTNLKFKSKIVSPGFNLSAMSLSTTPSSQTASNSSSLPSAKNTDTANLLQSTVSPISSNTTNSNRNNFTTSTPMNKLLKKNVSPEVENPEKNLAIEKDNILVIKPKQPDLLQLTMHQNLGKTANIMIHIFGKQSFIIEFDKHRKLLKKNICAATRSSYQDSLATVEIRLSSEYSLLITQLQNLELSILKSNESLSMLPADDKSKQLYDSILQKLKYIKILKKELKLSFPT